MMDGRIKSGNKDRSCARYSEAVIPAEESGEPGSMYPSVDYRNQHEPFLPAQGYMGPG